MEYIKLQNAEMQVSRVCMGGCPMGQHGWGHVEEQDLLDAVRVAVEQGVNFFDTADVYGLGKSEETLGKCLKSVRGDVHIATKFGVRIENGKTFYDNSPQWIAQAVERSLKKLDTDYIDLYQVHYRDEKTPISTVVETLERYKEKGVIRAYGLSNIHKNDVAELAQYRGMFTSVQNEYSLACRKNEMELLTILSDLQVTPMTWGSLGQGILTGKYDKNLSFGNDDRRSRDIYVNFYGEKLAKNLEIVEVMKKIAEQHRVSVTAVAVRFILDNLKESVVLVGAKSPKQIMGSIEGVDWKLEKKEIEALVEVSNE